MPQTLTDKIVQDYSNRSVEMSQSQLTTAILDLEALETGKTPQQNQQIGTLVEKLESDRKTRAGGEFAFSANSELHKMLMETTPDVFAARLLEENRGAVEATTGVHVSSHELLNHTPKELWPKMSAVGKQIEEQRNGSKANVQNTQYLADQFVTAVNELSGVNITNQQLKNVLREIPSVLVDQECKSIVHTTQIHENQTHQLVKSASDNELPTRHQEEAKGMIR